MKFRDLFIIIAAVALLAWGIGSLLREAGAQEHPPLNSPAHWYDTDCCNTTDCAPIPFESVEIESNGWRVTLYPGDHMNISAPKAIHFPFDDSRVRPSQDNRFHGCFSKSMRPLCFYVPKVQG